MPSSTLIVSLAIGLSNDELHGIMRHMRAARLAGATNVGCTIEGYDKDHRELWEIPEVRAFCRRLVTTGFISYLDYSTLADAAKPPDSVLFSFGAFEIWLVGEGKMLAGTTERPIEELVNFKDVLLRCNAAADAAIGSFEQRG